MTWQTGLLFEATDGRSRFLVCPGDALVVGRLPALPPQQVGVPDAQAAPAHLRILASPNSCTVENLDPAGATLVNGRRPDVPVAVGPGDELRMGHSLVLILRRLTAESLWDRLRQGALPLRDGLQLGQSAALALQDLHRLGLVHGGLTPHELLLEDRGGVVLIAHGQRVLDADGVFLGNPQYAAPETFGDGRLVAASDLYSLGCILFEALTGQVAFARDNVQQSMMAKLFGDLPRFPANWPVALTVLLSGLLDVSPAGRPSAQETARRLQVLLQ